MKKKSWLAVILLMLLTVTPSAAWGYDFFTGYASRQAKPVTDNPRILMIGNSLTYYNDLPAILRSMCASTGINAYVDSVTKGGHSMRQYAFPVTDSEKALRERLDQKLMQKWDYVVIQGKNDEAVTNPDGMKKALDHLYPLIQRTGAQLVLYLTWAPDYATPNYDIQQRQGKVAEVYYGLARQYNCALAPSGIAFARERLLYPEDDLHYSAKDRLHPNLKGSYLSGCCIYGTLFGRSPENLAYTAGLPMDQAIRLQGVAADLTVRGTSETAPEKTAVKAAAPGYQLKPGEVKKLSWSSPASARIIRCGSSNTAVAKVSANGTVTALTPGKAEISLLFHNNQKVTWDITVTEYARITLGAGDSQKLDFDTSGFKWKNSSKQTAVLKSGTIKAKKKGTAVLTGTNSRGHTVTLKVTVKSAPQKLYVKNKPERLAVGETLQLNMKVSGIRYTYSSSKPRVISVSEEGLLTARKKGSAVITVTSYNGKELSFRVKSVVFTRKLSITNAKSVLVMKRGKTKKLKVSFEPANVSSRNLTWSSSNKKVVSVDRNGKIRALRAGKARITVRTKDGSGKKAVLTVQVKK